MLRNVTVVNTKMASFAVYYNTLNFGNNLNGIFFCIYRVVENFRGYNFCGFRR
jgi:hypothetical protein